MPKQALMVDDSNLISLSVRPRLLIYIRQIFRRRYFILEEARSSANAISRGTILGSTWIILNPLLQSALYAFVFGVVLNTSRGIENFIGFLVIGVTFFQFLSRGITSGTLLIQRSRSMISSFSFPRASLAFSLTLRQLFDNIAPAIVGIAVALAFQNGGRWYFTIFLVIPLFALIHVFILGITLIIGRLTAFIPDLKQVIALVVRGLFFVSGTFFSIERFELEPTLQRIMLANPLYQFLEAIRTCVLDGEIPDVSTWTYLSAWSAGLFAIGFIYFWSAEERYNAIR